jgi:ParB family transcriptional regulator, chromosome partitioning protein
VDARHDRKLKMAKAKKALIDPDAIEANPHNPRLYFNDEKLDQLRTSLQEKGVLVPLIVYENPEAEGHYVLMDGERRWRSARDLGFDDVPVQVIPAPSPVENIVQMFNIHSVREEWSLVAIALALRELMQITGEDRESRLATMTGLTRSAVRRSKRLLSLPAEELERLQAEAPLDRADQVHTVDLYLEIERAESVLRRSIPEIEEHYPRADIIRQFARKREEGTLTNVTDFRDVSKLAEAADSDLVDRRRVVKAAADLIEDVDLNPPEIYERVAAQAVHQKDLARTSERLIRGLESVEDQELSQGLVEQLEELRGWIDALLSRAAK